MKIIGKTNDGFILEATKNELEKLENTYYGNGVFQVGTTVQIDKMYKQVDFLKRHRAEIETVQKNLQRINDNLTLLSPFVAPEAEDMVKEK